MKEILETVKSRYLSLKAKEKLVVNVTVGALAGLLLISFCGHKTHVEENVVADTSSLSTQKIPISNELYSSEFQKLMDYNMYDVVSCNDLMFRTGGFTMSTTRDGIDNCEKRFGKVKAFIDKYDSPATPADVMVYVNILKDKYEEVYPRFVAMRDEWDARNTR